MAEQTAKPTLLSGGNPQIAKGYGDGPVQAYIASKQKAVRYFHIHEHDVLDEAQLTAWVRHASALPGERM